MKWYENLLQNINSDFYTNYVNFLKKETGQEKLELFWKELYECSVIWEKKYHINNRKYQLYGAYGFDMFWYVDEFAFSDIKDNEQYLYILFFLSHFDGRTIKEEIQLLKEDNDNCDWTEIYMGNDIWEEPVPSVVLISENQFFEETLECIGRSLSRFKIRNEKYINDEYEKEITPQYIGIGEFLSNLKNLKGKKKIIKINEFGNDVSVRYFIESNKIMYSIRIDEFL